MDNNNLITELFNNQKKNLSYDKKLSYNDLKRISKYLTTSIFVDKCSIWHGYISTSKNIYINFYFNKKKHALHRLLYINYIDNLEDYEYIKYTCDNKGICCNINHMYKVNDNCNNIITIFNQKKLFNNIIVNL